MSQYLIVMPHTSQRSTSLVSKALLSDWFALLQNFVCISYLADTSYINQIQLLSKFHFLNNSTLCIQTTYILLLLSFWVQLLSSGLCFHDISFQFHFTNHVCLGTTENKNIYDKRKDVKWVERKDRRESGTITNMGITIENNILHS
jgi:hypothetical protein